MVATTRRSFGSSTMRAPVALMLLRNEGPLRPGNDNMRYRLQVFFGDRCGSHCRATTFDEATLLPLTPQLRTCPGGSDRFTLSARSGLMQRTKVCTRVANEARLKILSTRRYTDPHRFKYFSHSPFGVQSDAKVVCGLDASCRIRTTASRTSVPVAVRAIGGPSGTITGGPPARPR